MPKTRGNFWSEYEVTVDSNGKEKYTCKTCSGIWSKNASHLKENIEKCKDINVETETSQPQGTKRKRQQTFDEYKFAFTSKDQIILESLLIRAFCSASILFNVIENEDFILFLKKACFSFKIPSRFTLSNTLLDQEFEHLELVVNSALSENNVPNIKAAWKILKQKYPKKIFLGCWAHEMIDISVLTGITIFGWNYEFGQNYELISEKFQISDSKFRISDFCQINFGAILRNRIDFTLRYMMGSSYSYINQLFFTKSAIRSTIAEDHLNLDDRMKSLISSDTFWNDLGKIQNFLENFAIFIKKLEGDKTFLSTAYFEYQQLKAYMRNNTDLPENIREEVEKFGTNRW
ncbi:hypothetical protein GLOIN_2v1475481 [Rhizophagus irregularis DAOM 181602=DAOM 197198]|uniref:BED-type domain-containing protein n=1 Tax=Rhizophagus irregularis (strain DAOM 181602 / DAOM 197198 / MUCL 43194) TaxID=747089 RepID=A0A2P4QCM4_RHIID|nr:hypothetical protein GLOIN_2v1475481 [Rhizophagus irregularis DAOM 181602=DAOM 197198]POG75385.1 hypothetical protein GLOIN_2v1475481 [Rhizophagus irregularis DAOM 181602=DAOM 197198]|eukprot:XP_025182251.1 hypothetical protein GLOIN_2v1475481 [Rhizophagus irregularis DAOM 181602=DAOM 197198]